MAAPEADTAVVLEVDTVVQVAAMAVAGPVPGTAPDTDPAGAAVVDTTTMAMGMGFASMGTRSSDMAPTTTAVAATAKGAAGCAGAHSPQGAVIGGRVTKTASTTTIN